MSLCCTAVSGAYEADKKETLNSMLRVQTPYESRSLLEDLAIRTASCACAPLKCLEAGGLIACGAALWIVPATVCVIGTTHHGRDVEVTKVVPSLRKPNVPCHFYDKYVIPQVQDISSMGSTAIVTDTEGCAIHCPCPAHDEQVRETRRFHAESTVTGYNCVIAGLSKISATFLNIACCPILGVMFACRKI